MALQKGVAQTIGIICYDGETPTAPADLAAEVSTDGGALLPPITRLPASATVS